MASTTLKVSITGDASGIKKATKETESAVSGMSKNIKGALGAVAGAAFLKGAFDQAQEAQKVSAATAQVIKTTGGAAGLTAKQFASLADSISKVSGIDDEVIQSAENVLARFTEIGDAKTFERATQAATDLGVAMHTGPEAAAKLLGVALADPEKAAGRLKKAGVVLSDSQLALAKSFQVSGQEAKAQGVILDAVAAKVGGQAAAQATAADKARVAYENLQESVGTALLPVMNALSDGVAGVANAFNAQDPAMQKAELGALGAAAAYSKLAASETAAAVAASKLIPIAAVISAAYLSLKGDIAKGISNSFSKTSADELANSVDKVVSRLEKADDATSGAGGVINRAFDSIFNAGRDTRTPIVELDRLDKAMAALVRNGHAEQARKQFGEYSAAAIKAGVSAEQVGRSFNDYFDALDGGATVLERIVNGVTAQAAADAKATSSQRELNAAVKDGTLTTQQAHQVNKDRLASTLDQIEKNTALRASLHDLTESVKAYKENEADAAGQGPRSAAIRQQAAEQAVANAESIRQAEQAQVDAERGLQSSIRGVADAEHARAEAGRAVVAAQRGVEAAERGVADAVRNQQAAVRAVGEAEHSRLEALRSVESAERSLQSAERASAASVRDLTQARKDAAYQLASAALGARGDALSVQAAQFALADAQAAASKGPGTDNTDPNAQGKLNLAVAQAQLQLEQASQSATKAQEDLTDAQKKGVEGSDRVVSAQQAIEDSANAVADAHHGVTEAQRGVTAADQALVDAHHNVDQANRGVIDSIVTLEGAHHDLGEALRGVAAADQGIRDAHYEVAKAQQAVADAATATSKAVQKASDDQQIAQFELALVMNDAKKNSGALKDAIEKDMAAAATAATNLALPLVVIDALLSHITGGTPVDLSGFQAVTTASSYGSSGGTGSSGGGGGTFNQRKGPRNKGDETAGIGKGSTPTATPVEITRYDPSKLGPQIATSGKYKGIDLNPASHFGAPTGDLSYTSPADQAVIDMKAAMDAFLAQLAAQSSQPLQVTVTSTLDGTVVAQSTGKALATTAVSQGGRRPK